MGVAASTKNSTPESKSSLDHSKDQYSFVGIPASLTFKALCYTIYPFILGSGGAAFHN